MAVKFSRKKRIRIGVVGVGRGSSFADDAAAQTGLELVAICDTWEEQLNKVCRKLNVCAYTDYEKFLEHDMDAVVLANYFHQHAPFAIKALRAGKHVMSETSACFTLAEGVSLIREVEKSGKIYMFAENYPYMAFNQEMRRIYHSGKIGAFMYGEGEYVHPEPADIWMGLSCGIDHWRNWIPATYYCTHSLSPIMYITDTWPVKVNGFVIPYAKDDPVQQRTVRRNDAASMIAVRMDNGAMVKLLQVHLRGHSIWVRIHGSRGQMENDRVNEHMLRVRREQYHEKRTSPREMIYRPDFPIHHKLAVATGHFGADFFMNYYFAEAIRKNEQPFLDVYRGVAMSIVGILAYRSALKDSDSLEIPDLRKKSERRKYARDTWAPGPGKPGPGQPWPSVLGKTKIDEKGLKYARKIWKRSGFSGA